MADKAKKNLTKAIKARRKDEQKVAKKAAKTVKAVSPRKGTTLKAARQFQKANDNLMELPPLLWPFILFVCYQFVRNTLEKNQQERDLAEAQEFLRQSRGFR